MEEQESDEEELSSTEYISNSIKDKIRVILSEKTKLSFAVLSIIIFWSILRYFFLFSLIGIGFVTMFLCMIAISIFFVRWFATTNLSVEITVFLAKFFPPSLHPIWYTTNKLISSVPIQERPKISEHVSWTEIFRNNYQIILNEYLEFEKKYNYCPEMDEVYPNGSITNWDKKWPTVTLRCYNLDTEISKYFPQTMKIVNSSPVWISHVMYSILKPYKFIPRHRGPYRGVFRYQLSLEIPKIEDPLTNLYLAVWPNTSSHEFWYPENVPDGKPMTITWNNGLDFLFDDTCVHEVHNNTPKRRIILFADVERHDISWKSKLVHKIFMNVAKFLPAIKTAKKVQDGYIDKYGLKRCDKKIQNNDHNNNGEEGEEENSDMDGEEINNAWYWMNSAPEVLPYRKARIVIKNRQRLFGKKSK